MSQAAAQFATQFLEAWNAHDIGRLVALYAPAYEGMDVGDARPQRGLQGVRQTMARYLHAFPDLHFTEETTIVQGDRVALVWTARGTHQGKLMNIPPTGHPIEIRGASVFTLEGGKIKRATVIWDVAGFLRAIGLLPEL